jgi:hypothetical protein
MSTRQLGTATAAGVASLIGDTGLRTREVLPSDAMTSFFEAALEATTEEAVDNSMSRATSMSSGTGSATATPIDRVKALPGP